MEIYTPDDPHGRPRCQTRAAVSGGQCRRFQDHGGGHLYRKKS